MLVFKCFALFCFLVNNDHFWRLTLNSFIASNQLIYKHCKTCFNWSPSFAQGFWRRQWKIPIGKFRYPSKSLRAYIISTSFIIQIFMLNRKKLRLFLEWISMFHKQKTYLRFENELESLPWFLWFISTRSTCQQKHYFINFQLIGFCSWTKKIDILDFDIFEVFFSWIG